MCVASVKQRAEARIGVEFSRSPHWTLQWALQSVKPVKDVGLSILLKPDDSSEHLSLVSVPAQRSSEFMVRTGMTGYLLRRAKDTFWREGKPTGYFL